MITTIPHSRPMRRTKAALLGAPPLCALPLLLLGAGAAQAKAPAHPTATHAAGKGASAAQAKGAAHHATRVHQTFTLTDADAGKEVTLHYGDTLVIRLHDPGDSGDIRYILQDEQNGWLKQLPFQRGKGTGTPGSFGTDVYRFVVDPQFAGSSFAVAEYLRFFTIRPFEQDTAHGSFWQIHVIVGG